MEAANSSEVLVHIYQTTWRPNPEDSALSTVCCLHFHMAFQECETNNIF
jgi:hypothetical protein